LGINLSKVDIIIVNYNSTAYLLNCLQSIDEDIGSDHDNESQIYVIDNASADNVNLITDKFPKVILWKNSVNVGFSKAVNYLIARTRSPYILILNPDTYINNGFCKSILNFIEENPMVGIVGPKIFDTNGMIQGSARTFPTPLTALFGRSSILTKMFPNNKLTLKNILTKQPDHTKFIEVDWVSGACMLVRRRAIEEVGMMDERFFLYWEDADWCKRMFEKGWRVVYYPQASIIHHVGGSSKRRDIRSLLDFHMSVYEFFCKHSIKSNFSILKIIVFGALSIRFYLILIINLIIPLNKKSKRV
jgi:GT2 family glycosyltransferase